MRALRIGSRRFWMLWALGGLALTVMAGFAAAADYFPGDLRLTQWWQDVGGYARVAAFANVAGDAPVAAVTTLAAAIAFLLAGRFWATCIIVMTFVPRFFRNLLAEAVSRPRPSSDLVVVRDDASGFSFPSGHVVGAVVFYGTLFVLAELVPNRWGRLGLRAFCVFMVLAAGPARVYAGVHWPSDVIGGYLFGVLALALLVLVYRWRWEPRLPWRASSRGPIGRD